MKLITLRFFDRVIDAHLLKSKLESEGIPSFIFNEHISTLLPRYEDSNRVQLKVREEHLKEAQAILLELEYNSSSHRNSEMIPCPRCHSGNTKTYVVDYYGFIGFLRYLMHMTMALSPTRQLTKRECGNCGNRFKA